MNTQKYSDTVAHALEVITQGTEEIHSKNDLIQKLVKAEKESRQLVVKFGADPSSPDLHLGHTVVLRKLRQFQRLGHKVLMIIGDFTAMIGDPTGKSKTRPSLTLEQTRENAKSYVAQIGKVLDSSPNLLDVRFNSEWLEPLGSRGLIQIAASQTVAQMLQREDFANRFKNHLPIAVHELLYPMLQAYDSVAIRADIEFGGTDQTFNCLLGREFQKLHGQEEQVVITVPLIPGLDGKEKMSKSLGNHIGISDPAEVMFKKTMQIPDTLLLQYVQLCTDLSPTEAQKRIKEDAHEAHKWVAQELVRMYHGADAVEGAENHYATVASGSLPEMIEEFPVPLSEGQNGKIGIAKLTALTKLTTSTGEARRLITNGGIKIDGEKVTDPLSSIEMSSPIVLQRGKDKFVRVIFS